MRSEPTVTDRSASPALRGYGVTVTFVALDTVKVPKRVSEAVPGGWHKAPIPLL
jgi:hypothetical protein